MTVHDKYEVEINYELDQLGTKIDVGSDAHRTAVGAISQLTDRLIRLKEVDIEQQKLAMEEARMNADQEKANIEKQKLAMEQARMDDEKQDRKVKNVLAASSVLVPAGITLTGMVLMFLFEEKGTITSGAGRKIVDRIFRMK